MKLNQALKTSGQSSLNVMTNRFCSMTIKNFRRLGRSTSSGGGREKGVRSSERYTRVVWKVSDLNMKMAALVNES